ncbi:MAG: DUF459 domain-containing protein [Pseudomonadota bacterium]
MTFQSVLGAIMGAWLLLWPATLAAKEAPKENTQAPLRAPSAEEPLRIVVLGDSLADGLHYGLTQLNKDRADIKTIKKARVNTGLVRRDRYDWNKGTRKIMRKGSYDVAVVLLGLNDLQSIREKGKAHHFQTDGWVERYQARLEEMIGDLKKAGVAVYWASIPITTRYPQEYQYLNTFFAAAAKKMDIGYVDTWSALADEQGNYTAFFTMPDGKKKEIRRRDGVHFTPKGYEAFASLVNDRLMADLEKAAAPSQ